MSPLEKIKGFTLVELLISIAIVGIIASVAYPTYQSNVQKSHRADAQSALMSLVNKMERTFTETNDYTNVPQQQPTQYYTFNNNATQTTYQLQAVPIPGSGQADDPCGVLSIDNLGVKGPVGQAGCWQ